MIALRYSDRSQVRIDEAHRLGHGGEAVVYAVAGEPSMAAKIYLDPTTERAAKLTAMLACPPLEPSGARGHASFAWPLDLLISNERKRRPIGYLMPRVSHAGKLVDFYLPSNRRVNAPRFTYRHLIRTARNMAATVEALHAAGHVVGDINESNVLVSREGLVTFVDTDSFQIREPGGQTYRCLVGRREFTPPEIQALSFRTVTRRPEHDSFGLGVLIFQLLMEGRHPFNGWYVEEDEPPPLDARIACGHFVYGVHDTPYEPDDVPPLFEDLHPKLQRLFVRCFELGHLDPRQRPTASEWREALERTEASLAACSVTPRHLYFGHLTVCPWCARLEMLGGRDSFPSVDTRELATAEFEGTTPQNASRLSIPISFPTISEERRITLALVLQSLRVRLAVLAGRYRGVRRRM